jgi:predicted phage tail protein
LNNGSYTVIAWNGKSETVPYNTTLTVSSEGTIASPSGIVFTISTPTTQVRTYQIERITPNDDGTFSIEAVHMPTDELVANWNSATAWVIEG